ncbi:MAG: hypothetical protein HDT19_00570 [Oscillibacter sp.]|nr:hypothetical protein [Oscillibacter sp.]
MADYQKMYTTLFSAATEALNMLKQGRIDESRYILKQGQRQAEAIYRNTSGQETK